MQMDFNVSKVAMKVDHLSLKPLHYRHNHIQLSITINLSGKVLQISKRKCKEKEHPS